MFVQYPGRAKAAQPHVWNIMSVQATGAVTTARAATTV